jgi:hypothetical protein
MLTIRNEWFRLQQTANTARRVVIQLDTFRRLSARDYHAGVQLFLHELAAELLTEIGLNNVARDVRFRMGKLEKTIDEATAYAAQRKNSWRRARRAAASASEPEPAGSEHP